MLINEKELDIKPGADLHGADLHDVDLHGANLYGANLSGADLSGADLDGANLSGTSLRNANLHGANLHGARLRSADLCGANLSGADLRSADLRNANLCGADLRSADLRDANLHGVDLCDANLRGAENIPSCLDKITPEGDLIGYKKLYNNVICTLKIPTDALRHNATGRKCRAEYAIVIDGEGVSEYDRTFIYKIGETVRPRVLFNRNRWKECSSGIHFFLTREEAENY